jgi:hypothetical protein
MLSGATKTHTNGDISEHTQTPLPNLFCFISRLSTLLKGYLIASALRASTLVSNPPMAPLLCVGKNPMTATKTVRIPQAGCQYSGWYPVMLKHTFLCSSKRPLGYVCNPIEEINVFHKLTVHLPRSQHSHIGYRICLVEIVYRQEHETGRSKRVVIGQQDATMVQSAFELCLLWPSDSEMPLKDIRLINEQRWDD